jgi:hypothetical protein
MEIEKSEEVTKLLEQEIYRQEETFRSNVLCGVHDRGWQVCDQFRFLAQICIKIGRSSKWERNGKDGIAVSVMRGL